MMMRVIMLTLLLGLVLAGPAARADDYLWCWNDDLVTAEVAGGEVVINHRATVYNCCCDPFDYALSWEGDVLVVTEHEVLTNPCYCICCFDLSVTLTELDPGDLDLLFRWWDEETDQWAEAALSVTVPGVPAVAAVAGPSPNRAAVSDATRSECLSGAAAVPDDERPDPSWDGVKAWYR